MGATRMSGLISGLDTDTLISQLVSARRTKVKTQEKAQTKLSWKQDLWKDLNTQLKSLQNKIGNMRFTSSFQKKTTAVSNSAKASVITGDGAVNSVQTLKINSLAKSGYLTGAKVGATDSEGNATKATAMSTLSELGYTGGSGKISVATGTENVDIDISGSTTISSVLTKLKDAGLNASFDATNQRFFVSSKTTGKESDFSITASDTNGQNALEALGLATNVSSDKATKEKYTTLSSYTDAEGNFTTAGTKAVNSEVNSRVKSYVDRYSTLQKSISSAQNTIAELEAKGLNDSEYYAGEIETSNAKLTALKEELSGLDKNASDYEEKKAELQSQIDEENENLTTLKANKSDAEKLASTTSSLEKMQNEVSEIENYVDITPTTVTDEDGNETTTYEGVAKQSLTDEVEASVKSKSTYAKTALDGKEGVEYATKINGQDAEIELNGATFTNSTNVFAINGLTITALDETAENESVTLTTTDDTAGIYDMVKSFIKEYNTIINKLDTLYNADSAKGYEPLSDEEKDALSDTEVEDYEKKIKDALLKGDSTVRTITSSLTSGMSKGFTVNGKTMYLSDFGIGTLSYFTAADNEKHAYHIDGDTDDSNTGGNTDKLKSMIASDPETVVSFFTKLSQDLYKSMDNMSKSVAGYRTYGSFYDDKKMSSDYSSYSTKISELNDAADDFEDRLYTRFSKMESALAKLQSSASSITGILGQ